ncbi:hypothetical protein [Natronospora cellulosivora (SeqCode)]
MFNPIIIIAIIIQLVVAKKSRKTGAIIGYIITTGILFWGLSLYTTGYRIALFGIGLSLPVFMISIAVWYFFDTVEYKAAIKETSESKTSEI